MKKLVEAFSEGHVPSHNSIENSTSAGAIIDPPVQSIG